MPYPLCPTFFTSWIKRADVFGTSLPLASTTKESSSFIRHRSRWWKIWSQLLSLHGSTTWWAIMTSTFLIPSQFFSILSSFLSFFCRNSLSLSPSFSSSPFYSSSSIPFFMGCLKATYRCIAVSRFRWFVWCGDSCIR